MSELGYYESLYKAYSSALYDACEHIVHATQTCPADEFGWDRDCASECNSRIDMAECWELYFTREES